jgi:hypothetical protein
MKTGDFPPGGVQVVVLGLCIIICIVAAVAWNLFHNDDQ